MTALKLDLTRLKNTKELNGRSHCLLGGGGFWIIWAVALPSLSCLHLRHGNRSSSSLQKLLSASLDTLFTPLPPRSNTFGTEKGKPERRSDKLCKKLRVQIDSGAKSWTISGIEVEVKVRVGSVGDQVGALPAAGGAITP